MDELLKAVGNVGFPITVAGYLLIRIEGKLDRLSTCVMSTLFVENPIKIT